MSSRQEVPYQNGVVAPDPQEVERVNSFTGPIPQPSRLLKGTAAVLGLGTVAFLADACAPSARPAEVRPVGGAPAQPSEPQKAPRPEAAKSREQQAALDAFYGLLNTTQRIDPRSWASIPSKILESRVVSREGDLWKVRWIFISQKQGQYSTSSILGGEAEISNLRVQVASFPLSGADQLNKLEWKGTVQVEYATRYRFVVPYFGSAGNSVSYVNTPDLPKVLRLIPEPSGPFTPWQEANLPFSLELRGGRWENNLQSTQQQFNTMVYPIPNYDGASLTQGNCSPWARQLAPGCEIVVIDTSKK